MSSYYLSDMNVSAKHGGGLTLMRIIGEEMEMFDGLIRVSKYDKHLDSHQSILSKEINLFRTPGAFQMPPMPSRLSKDYFINQFKRIFKLPNLKYSDRDYYGKYYTEYLRDEVKVDFASDHFLVVPQRPLSVWYANFLHQQFGMNYVTWIMDDNLLAYSSKDDAYIYHRDYEKTFSYHLRHARHVFTISANMGQFYKDRFGVDYSVLFSPTDPVKGFSVNGQKRKTDSIKLCHFGRVWRWPLDAVETFSDHLEELDAELDIYSHQSLEGKLLNNPRVNVCEPVSGSDVLAKMKEYDAVTIFYGFDDEVRHWTEMNISTKMSECLASGIPTLFVGPEYAAMAQFAMKHQCGIVITDLEDQKQVEQVGQLRNSDFAKAVVERSLKVAGEFTSTKVMKQRWKEGWGKLEAGR